MSTDVIHSKRGKNRKILFLRKKDLGKAFCESYGFYVNPKKKRALESSALSVAFSPDGQSLASGSGD